MTKAQKLYRVFRDYLPRAESRYATIQLLKIWEKDLTDDKTHD